MTIPVIVGVALLLAPQGTTSAPRTPTTSGAPAASVVPATPAAAHLGSAPTFEQMWSSFVRADAAGDAPAAEGALREIRRSRIERNVPSLDTVGLALVERGLAKLEAGERESAEEAFRLAVDLAPGLPDGHAGLAKALLKKGPLGVVPSIRTAWEGLSAFRSTGRGAVHFRNLATLAALVSAFGMVAALAVALLLRRGGLLRHDLEEWLGPAHNRSASLALFLLLLLLPVATFQGWGWLPLWWLALVFAYLDRTERALVMLAGAAALAVGPAVSTLELRLRTELNPLYHAALSAVESEPSAAVIGQLEEARGASPEDRDLVYLLGPARKRAGRYEEAAELYRRVLAAHPGDAVASNNLANIEFVRGHYDPARARYRAGTDSGAAPGIVATSYYNLSLAHLQKFEYQAYNEAKSNADRLAPGLVAEYDRWKYDSRDYAVVDLGLTRDEVWEKFAGSDSGAGVPNIASGARPPSRWLARARSMLNPFAASVVVLGLAAMAIVRWRGPKAFTLHCRRCGTAFCRYCHLGQVSGELCSQCYHLFVVRDGVSGPARNRKVAEVQKAETRRARVFRVLSIASPGAGQVYGGWTLRGAALMVLWYGVLGLVAAGRLVPLTEVSRRLSPPWAGLAAGLVLVLVWVVANRFRPSVDLELPSRPSGARRARVAQAAG